MSFESRAHHELVPVSDPIEESGKRRKIVRAVRIGHDDDVAGGRGEPGHVRGTVSAAALAHHARARGRRDLGGPVGGPVIDDDDFAGDTGFFHRVERFTDDGGNALDFVEARKDHRHAFAHGVRLSVVTRAKPYATPPRRGRRPQPTLPRR